MMDMMVEHGTGADTGVAAWSAATRAMCVARLREAYDPRTGLFSRQFRNGVWDATGDAEASTSTAICLVALSRGGIDPAELGVDTGRSLQAIDRLLVRYPGGTGLALWAAAVNGTDRAARYGLERGIGRLLPRLTTMETSWLLSGLLHARRASEGAFLAGAIDGCLSEILGRQRAQGLFAHAGRGASLLDRLRGDFANFADQIYAVQALGLAAIELGSSEALEAGCRCADALFERRGSLEQWWWHYDVRDGSISRHYPVYAVHQHGMAPMAFMTLDAAGAPAYRERGWLGLEWLHRNELGRPLHDAAAGTIWRDIEVEESAMARRLRDVREMVSRGGEREESQRFRLNLETRPYEWGWCLMAGAMFSTPAHGGHIA